MGWQRAQSAEDRLARHPAVRKAELDAAAAADQLTVQKAERWPKLVFHATREHAAKLA